MIENNENIKYLFNIELKSNSRYWAVMVSAVLLLIWFVYSIFATLSGGLESWNIDNNVVWGLAVTNFVFWIGIAHAGTLISAILFLFRQDWRKPISKISETMTLVAILCAVFFPLIHLGRPWFSFWIIPIFNRSLLNNNYYSPLTWDFVAVTSYFFVSLIFLYLSLIPYFSRFSTQRKGKLYSILGMNWIGTQIQWGVYNTAYKFIAGLATALVISVHSIVSYDFAVTHLAGWHSTIFPPYFVIGAILSGCAMIITILQLFTFVYKINSPSEQFNYDKIAKLILFCVNALAFIYIIEAFFAWYSASDLEISILNYRIGPTYYFMLFFIVILPQVLWFKNIYSKPFAMLFVSVFINIGMLIERYIIITSVLNKGHENIYFPNIIEIGLFFGSVGFFVCAMLLIFKHLPVLKIKKY